MNYLSRQLRFASRNIHPTPPTKQRNYFKPTDKVLLAVTVGFKYFSKVCPLTAVNSFTIITSTGARSLRFSVVVQAAKRVLNLVSSPCTMSLSVSLHNNFVRSNFDYPIHERHFG